MLGSKLNIIIFTTLALYYTIYILTDFVIKKKICPQVHDQKNTYNNTNKYLNISFAHQYKHNLKTVLLQILVCVLKAKLRITWINIDQHIPL